MIDIEDINIYMNNIKNNNVVHSAVIVHWVIILQNPFLHSWKQKVTDLMKIKTD